MEITKTDKYAHNIQLYTNSRNTSPIVMQKRKKRKEKKNNTNKKHYREKGNILVIWDQRGERRPTGGHLVISAHTAFEALELHISGLAQTCRSRSPATSEDEPLKSMRKEDRRTLSPLRSSTSLQSKINWNVKN